MGGGAELSAGAGAARSSDAAGTVRVGDVCAACVALLGPDYDPEPELKHGPKPEPGTEYATL